MRCLLIPMRLDALCLSEPYAVTKTMADFSRLPHAGIDGVENAETPAVSDFILSDPLGQPSLLLAPGVHLHWALPDTLTRGVYKDDKLTFPAVPNRWLVTRRLHGEVQARWVVESDYLHPEGARPSDAVTIPYTPKANESQPFRHLGRRLELADWQKDDGHDYLRVLSAMGPYDQLDSLDYVKGTFAALYPSARSCFGLHDDSFADGVIPAGLAYDVIGWYSDPAHDFLAAWVASKKERDPTSLLAAMADELDWTCDLGGGAFPDKVLCYARLTFRTGGAHPQPDPSRLPLPDLSVGNTSTEALSAYLATEIDITHKGLLEDQLEALELESQLAHNALDMGPKFVEARHGKGFHRHGGGQIYTVQTRTGADASGDPGPGPLPVELANDLGDLNRAAEAMLGIHHEVLACRQQVFADWCKAQLASYGEERRNTWPDGDDILAFIDEHDLPAFDDATARLAGQKRDVDALAQALSQKLAAYNQQQGTTLKLATASAPDFYRANEPVVMLLGEATTPTLRHGQDGHSRPDGLLHAEVLGQAIDLAALPAATLSALDQAIAGVDPTSSEGFCDWTEQPWNPLMLGWKVEVFPDPRSDDETPDEGDVDYDPKLIENHYELPENASDLAVAVAPGLALPTSVYRGSSILSPHTRGEFVDRVAEYLKRELDPDVLGADGDLDGDIAAVKKKYAQARALTTTRQRAQDPVYTALCAYEKLQGRSCSSQMLGGLNDALLTAHQAMQLAIADPRADAKTQALIQRIAACVGTGLGLAPYPNDFSPLRAGAMDILDLRLIDTFGQVLDLRDLHRLRSVTMTVSEPLRHPGGNHPIYLRPRLAQPARLDFRWLSAVDGKRSPSEHPATTPVCGWLLPNNLDDTLMVYDNQGNGLGFIDRQATWQPMPGSAEAVGVADIGNRYLQRVVRFVLAQGPTFMDPFLSALDNALEGIDPESFATHRALSLLIARPIAVVRASVDLQMFGPAAHDQGERAMKRAIATGSHTDRGLSRVEFPIRLGEYRQFNDGLVGYWPEDDKGEITGDVFYAPQSQVVPHASIRTCADGKVGISQSIVGAAATMTLLVDPRGCVHATCGILPTTSIEIRSQHYAHALQSIQAVFSTAPVVMEAGKTELSMPTEPGYGWSWLTRSGDGSWAETTAFSPMQTTAAFAGPHRLVGGWLKLTPRLTDTNNDGN